ncbi:MAG: hypothetical protein K5873_11920 [Treponema sp.]|nr:hypothetical protein [Treponema sp.]
MPAHVVFLSFLILLISMVIVLSAGWPGFLIPILMVGWFLYVVLSDSLIWKKQKKNSKKERDSSKKNKNLPVFTEDSDSSSSDDSDGDDSDNDSYSGGDGDFGGGGASDSW